jgi:hypothetical protein
MLHPFMTQESVRRRRAALDAEARNQRVVHQLQLGTHTDPGRGRFAATRGRWHARSAPWSPGPPEPSDLRGPS